MKIIEEFKAFAVKGNAIDLAVGVIIGGAFGKIVSSLVNDILMPPIGFLMGGINFSDLKIFLHGAAENETPLTLNYGNFLQATIDFLIIAFSIFLFVKAINKLARREAAKAKEPTNQEKLLMEIRDLLKGKS